MPPFTGQLGTGGSQLGNIQLGTGPSVSSTVLRPIPTYPGTYGGLAPGFERYGGRRSEVLLALVNALAQQRGTAYDNDPSQVADPTSVSMYVENQAIARALAECWSNNVRMANQWDTRRMTDFIPRWETILAIVPGEGDSDNARRQRIAQAFARVTQIGVYQQTVDLLTAILGDVFVAIHTVNSSSANVWTPDATWNVGQHDPTHLVNFYSTVAEIFIEVQQPAKMPDWEFYQTVGLINTILDTLLPAWVTWNWFRSPSGTPGFFLDTGWPGGVVPAGAPEVNLDNEGLT